MFRILKLELKSNSDASFFVAECMLAASWTDVLLLMMFMAGRDASPLFPLAPLAGLVSGELLILSEVTLF